MDNYYNKLCGRCIYLLSKIKATDNQIKNIEDLMNHRENRLRDLQSSGIHKDSLKTCFQLLEDNILIHSELLNKQRKRHLKLMKHYKKNHHDD